MPELSAAPRQEILDAIAYINAHYAEKIDLETIASQIHLSKYYFCRIFREVTGATVLEYLTNVRLTRAGRLLVAEDRICVIGAFFQNLPQCLWCQSQ